MDGARVSLRELLGQSFRDAPPHELNLRLDLRSWISVSPKNLNNFLPSFRFCVTLITEVDKEGNNWQRSTRTFPDSTVFVGRNFSTTVFLTTANSLMSASLA